MIQTVYKTQSHIDNIISYPASKSIPHMSISAIFLTKL